jgi:uncharacterized protein
MKAIRFAILTGLGLVVFAATMTFSGVLPNTVAVRAGLMAVLGALWWSARREGPLNAWRPVLLATFAIVAGLTVDWLFTTPIMQVLHLGFTPMSNAIAKAVEAGLIGVTVIAILTAGGERLETSYLCRGRLWFGLGLGLIGFCAMAVVTFIPGGPFFRSGVLDVALVATVAPWVLLFVLTNAFMEELLFRAVLLKRYEALIGAWPALIATTLVFALAHVRVNYTAQLIGFVAFVFGVGLLWGLLMQKSKSIWGAVLFHAGADVCIILPMYQAMIAVR